MLQVCHDCQASSKQEAPRGPWKWRRIVAGGFVFLVVVYLCICWSIGAGVRSISGTAFRTYSGDRVSALMALVESEQHTLRDRNRAIWALGQLGDARALSVLEKHYTGKPSDERTGLSQYELKKAIVLCRGAVNISAPVWRHGTMAMR
jgi:hypothetical protein